MWRGRGNTTTYTGGRRVLVAHNHDLERDRLTSPNIASVQFRGTSVTSVSYGDKSTAVS